MSEIAMLRQKPSKVAGNSLSFLSDAGSLDKQANSDTLAVILYQRSARDAGGPPHEFHPCWKSLTAIPFGGTRQ